MSYGKPGRTHYETPWGEMGCYGSVYAAETTKEISEVTCKNCIRNMELDHEDIRRQPVGRTKQVQNNDGNNRSQEYS